jgi:hypothetical protein
VAMNPGPGWRPVSVASKLPFSLVMFAICHLKNVAITFVYFWSRHPKGRRRIP